MIITRSLLSFCWTCSCFFRFRRRWRRRSNYHIRIHYFTHHSWQNRLYGSESSPSSWLCVALPSVWLSPPHSNPLLRLMFPKHIQHTVLSPLSAREWPVILTQYIDLRQSGIITPVKGGSSTVHLLLLLLDRGACWEMHTTSTRAEPDYTAVYQWGLRRAFRCCTGKFRTCIKFYHTLQHRLFAVTLQEIRCVSWLLKKKRKTNM